MRLSLIRCAIVFLLALVPSACGTASTQGPTTWLDQPLDGAKLALEPQEVTAHASDEDGVASLEFYVGSTLLAHAPVGGGVLEDKTVGWNPSTPGVYTVSALATDTQGNTGPETSVIVTVGEVEGSPTPLPTVQPTTLRSPTVAPGAETPTATGTAATTPVTPTPTGTSVPTRTATPTARATSTPTTPSRAPEITYFEANPGTINAGDCSTLRWGVEYAAEVYLDGEGVVDHDARQVCPSSTTTYSLLAKASGVEQSASATVTVREPTPTPTTEPVTPTPIVTFVIPDFDPPYVTNLDANPASITADVFPCTGQQTTVSVFADDPSGVASVVAHWTLGSQSGQVNMAPQGGGVYRAVLGPFDDTGNLLISFVASDTLGHSSSPPVGPITVVVHSVC